VHSAILSSKNLAGAQSNILALYPEIYSIAGLSITIALPGWRGED